MTRKERLRDRSIFKTGEYRQYFRPEDANCVFAELYRNKMRDIISLVEGVDVKVLDVGAGPGRISRVIADRGEVFLCDIDIEALRQANDRAGGRSYPALADAHFLPFEDGQFDYVLAIDLLVHLEKPALALAEFGRVMRPQGRLIIDSTNGNPLWTIFYPSYVGWNPARWIKTLTGGGVLPEWQAIVRHYSKKAFLGMLADAGFVITDERAYGPPICPKWHLVRAMRADYQKGRGS